ncbi:hypothetical protein VB776_20355 [Arcicella sp. DC2W]|uniref:Uncharacterized protein n=1 Tax=Arcicella gelida TaxID=2984195 RepID=A0ABU5SA16_9BACT|nr:hypothetical protein [Arcicella sp. DC2W]MEA5405301.1 hypothetical protein [Arcicella sp. DC2W]
MVVLKRYISPYSGKNIVLGVYSTTKIANDAKQLYLEKCKTVDKWSEQPYRKVNLDIDVSIEDISDILVFHEGLSNGIIYLINSVEEGFGQIGSRIIKVFFDESDAKEYVIEMEKQEKEYEPSWYEIEIKTLDSFDLED